MNRITILIIILFVSSLAQTWTQKNPSTHPSAREDIAFTYDSESDRIVLFGGSAGTSIYGQTWEYDLNTDTWTELFPAPAPSARTAAAMAYDSESNRIILFGGQDVVSQLNDTWEYDLNTNTWLELFPTLSPSARRGHAMAYDSENDVIVLFAGFDGTYRYDTWEYDYNSNTWTLRSPALHPPGGFVYDAMAYDGESDRMILFGGYSGSGNFSDQTWTYDVNTTTWTLQSPTSKPSARCGVNLGYDIVSDRIILFGGYRQTNRYDDTWEYDYNNDSWTQENPNPHPLARGEGGLAYDYESDRCVLFGGDGPSPGNLLSDTWEYDEPYIEISEERKSILSMNWSVAPNPFTRHATVVFNSNVALKLNTLQVFDISGRLLQELPVTSSRFNFGSNLKAGVYFIKCGDSKLTKVVKLSR